MDNHGNVILNTLLNNLEIPESYGISWCGLLGENNKEVSYKGYKRIKLPLPEGEWALKWPISKVPYAVEALGIFSTNKSDKPFLTITLKNKVIVQERSTPSLNVYKLIKGMDCEDY